MKKITNLKNALITVSVLFISSCGSGVPDGLTALRLIRNDEKSAKATFKTSSGDLKTLTLPIEFDAGTEWKRIDKTIYLRTEIIRKIESGSMKVVTESNGDVSFTPTE